MNSITKTGVEYKGEKTTAYLLGDNEYAVRTSYGLIQVSGASPDLFLCGPLEDTDATQEQLREVYEDAAGWSDADDMAYYVEMLTRCHPDSICLHGKRYHLDEMDAAQLWVDVNGPEDI